MDSAAAARFLTPNAFLLALAAAAPSLGTPHPPFHPTIHALVIANPTPTRSALFHSLSAVLITTSSATPSPPHPLQLPLSALLTRLLPNLLSSPHALLSAAPLLAHHAHPHLFSAYHPDSRVALFLRAALVAFRSLSFESLAALRVSLQTPPPSSSSSSSPAVPPQNLRPVLDAARARNFSLAHAHTHAHFDAHATRLPPRAAALALAVLHARFAHHRPAAAALRDALHLAHAARDPACQTAALRWLARVEPPDVADRLLLHTADALALVRHRLLTSTPPPPSAFPPLGRAVNALLLAAAAHQARAALPTALCLARAALAHVKPHSPDALARATVAVADLQALNGHFPEANRTLRTCLHTLRQPPSEPQPPHHSTNTEPEQLLVHRALAVLALHRNLRAADFSAASADADTLAALAHCADVDALSFSPHDAHLDAREARLMCLLLADDSRGAAAYALRLAKRAAVLRRPQRVVNALRLRAEAFLVSQEPTSALPDALAAVSLAHSMRLRAVHITSTLTLVETFLRMRGPYSQPMQLLLKVLPIALEGLGTQVRARAYRLYAECHMAKCDENGVVPGDQVIRLLQQAREAYERSEDCFGVRDCLYMLARVYHWREDLVMRNRVAGMFRRHINDSMGRRQTPPSVIKT